MALTAMAAVGLPILVAAGPAGAANRVGLYLESYKLPPGSTETFSDLGGNCDGGKVQPKLTVQPDARYPDHGDTRVVDLFTAKTTGSCAFQGSNAQFLITVRTPATSVGTTRLNVTQNNGAGTNYVAQCYDTKGMTCYGDTRGTAPSSGSVAVHVALGPVTGPYTAAPAGYTFCAEENGGCSFGQSSNARASIAYGTDGVYLYADRSFVGGGVKCTGASLGGDPTPGKWKACFYKIITN